MVTKKFLTLILAGTLTFGTIAPAYAQEMPSIEPEQAPSKVPGAAPVPEETASSSPEAPLATEAVPIELATTTEPASEEVTVAAETEEIIVKFREDALDLDRTSGRREATETIMSADAVLEEHLTDANSTVVSVSSDQDVAAVISDLESDPNVEYAEPNHSRSFFAMTVNDTQFANQWSLANTGQTYNSVAGTVGADISINDAWGLSLGTSTVVAVIDNGVQYNHPDLVNNMWDGSACVSETGAALGNCVHGYDFADNDLTPLPQATTTSENTHGTHVAGIIGAQTDNATGIAGIAPNTKIMALRFNMFVSTEVKAIDFATRNGVKIINASYGGTTFSQSEYDAIARFRDAGGIFIAAAGNDGTDNDSAPLYPASYDLPNIVSVAATDHTDTLASFSVGGSNYGEDTVDLAAPGRFILSTVTTDGTDAGYNRLSGTSMAAPHVAGVAALLKSLYPNADMATLKDALMSSGSTTPSLVGKTVSGKRLDAFAALGYLATDTTPPVITLTGDASVSLTVGDTYTELGATALDGRDGSVSVVISGDTVDTSTAGTYTVRYNASDTSLNAATEVTRTVTVSEAPAPTPRRRSGGGGGGGGGGNRVTSVTNDVARPLLAADNPYASMTPEARAQLLQTLLTLLLKLQTQLAALRAQGL